MKTANSLYPKCYRLTFAYETVFQINNESQVVFIYMQLIALIIAFTINALDIIFSMFKTFFNAILISVMVLVHCDNSKIVFNDRVFRYVGNLSSQEPIEDTIEDTNDLQENLKTDSKSEVIAFKFLLIEVYIEFYNYYSSF